MTTWVSSSTTSLTRTPYYVFVDLSAKRLLLYRESKLVMRAPAMVGAPQTPTPTGRFFVALLAQAPNPTYGPFVVVTSAFTGSVTDWEQDGDGMVAITGPLDGAMAIRAGGAQQSRGGVRLLDRDLERLRSLPAGTPVDIVTTLNPPKQAGLHHHPHPASERAS